ncbi:MAG: hypothetical protein WCK11_00775 [Candidatus Falkowbacteria bacterium]
MKKEFIVILFFLLISPVMTRAAVKEYGPYNACKEPIAVKNDWYAICYDDTSTFILKNGEKIVSYDDIAKLSVSNSGLKYMYRKDYRTYVKIGTQEFGPFQDDQYVRLKTSGDNWAIVYQSPDKLTTEDEELLRYYNIFDAFDASQLWELKALLNTPTDSGLGLGTYVPMSQNTKKYFVQTKTGLFGPFDSFGPYGTFSNTDTLASDAYSNVIVKDQFVGFGYLNNDQGFININGKDFSGVSYDSLVTNESSYAFKQADSLIFNGKSFGPYTFDKIYFDDNGLFIVTEGSKGQVVVKIADLKAGVANVKSSGTDKSITIIDKGRKQYVRIDMIEVKRMSEQQVIIISGKKLGELLKLNNTVKNVAAQKSTMTKYTEPLVKGQKITTEQKYAINNFIVYGTNSTKKLTQVKRYEAVKKFKTKNKRLPTSEKDWKAVLAAVVK